MNRPNNKNIFLLSLLLFLNLKVFPQGADSIYHRTFVNHYDNTICDHELPDVSFMVFLNRNETSILIENTPRWDEAGSPNIESGSFGVELANFTNPDIHIGDSVYFRFTCGSKKEQGFLASRLPSIPWIFSTSIKLKKVELPAKPVNVLLTVDSTTGYRTISWNTVAGLKYKVYRRMIDDLTIYGKKRMLYSLIADNLTTGDFVDTFAVIDKKYGYIIFAVSDQNVFSIHSNEVNEEPVLNAGDDLSISYITRLPVINWTWNAEDPKYMGWPAIGQKVYWQANVKNWFAKTLTNVKYKWYLDDQLADSGVVNINTGDTVNVSFPWTWTFDRHTIGFVIDTDNNFYEEEEENNELLVYTNAITVGFYVEQSVYDYFKKYQKELTGIHSNCWSDWAQRHIKRWNQMLAGAIFPESPNGAIDRIRLDKITIVPDGALPLAGGLPTNNPNLNDRSVDLQWGFTTEGIPPTGTFYSNHSSVSDNNPFYFEGSLFHELGHARYLIDLYGFNVHDNGSGNTIGIKENGRLIVGTSYMPLAGDAVYYGKINGLMNGQYTYIDRYSTAALNLIAGHRAVQGNCNAPGNIGIFMNDLPVNNIITVKDNSGNILANASVKIYQATGQTGVWYGKYFDNIPDLSFTTDPLGRMNLGKCPFDSKDNFIDHDYGISNGVIVLRVEYNGFVGYTFLESTFFNLEYWRGNTDSAAYEVKVKLITPTVVEDKNKLKNFIYELNQNYPNPFNPSTKIDYQVATTGFVSLKVYDVIGNEIALLVGDVKKPGKYEVMWDGKNYNGKDVSSGIYLYKLETGNYSLTKKMGLIR